MLLAAAAAAVPVAQATFREDRFTAATRRVGEFAPRVGEKFLRVYPPRGSERDKVETVHQFFQDTLSYDSDLNIWGLDDYWASPVEFFGKARGDCEDYALGKYVALLDAGVPASKLRAFYVNARRSSGAIEPHMVLAYFPDGLGRDPLILDNIDPSPKFASQRSDLTPLFMFTLSGDVTDLPGRAPANRGTKPAWFSNRESYVRKTEQDGFLN